MAVNGYDRLTSTTLAKYRKRMTDNIFTARPLTYWLFNKNRIRFESGGTKVVEPLVYAGVGGSVAASYSGFDTITLSNVDAVDGIAAAEFDWRQYWGWLSISGIEDAKNRGDEAVLNLYEAKIMQLEESMGDGFNTMFYADGTGNTNKDWLGLGIAVEAAGTFGGIDRATYTWWQSYEENTAAALTVPQMATAYNTVSKGNDTPDFIITTQTLFEKYEALVQPNLRYQDAKTADAGFQNLVYKGAPVMFDTACTSGVMYFLNSKYLGIVGHKNNWFKLSEKREPTNGDAVYQMIKCYGNLTARNCKRLGKLTAKTA